MERLRRIKQRIKKFGDAIDTEEMVKQYESVQHGKRDQMDFLGPKEKFMMQLVKEGDVEKLKQHLEVRLRNSIG